jgi:hypothetical protein
MFVANGTVPTLVGKYLDDLMLKGGAQPSTGDAAYPETAMFGVHAVGSRHTMCVTNAGVVVQQLPKSRVRQLSRADPLVVR